MAKKVKLELTPERVELFKERGITTEMLGIPLPNFTDMCISKGVTLKEGTILLGPYHGDIFKARIKNGRVTVDGEGIRPADRNKVFLDLPTATNFITKPFRSNEENTTSVWAFWLWVWHPDDPKKLVELKSLINPDKEK